MCLLSHKLCVFVGKICLLNCRHLHKLSLRDNFAVDYDSLTSVLPHCQVGAASKWVGCMLGLQVFRAYVWCANLEMRLRLSLSRVCVCVCLQGLRQLLLSKGVPDACLKELLGMEACSVLID